MQLSRREFIRRTTVCASSALIAAAIPASVWALATPKSLLIVGNGKGRDGAAIVYCMQTQLMRSVPLGFTPHSFLQHPRQAKRVWTIEKWGRHAAEIDIEEGVVTRRIQTAEGAEFYGHGVFAPDGETLFITHVIKAAGNGHLLGFDSATGKQVADYPVTVAGLHDTQLLPDGTALVTSVGKRGYWNADAGAVSERLEPSALVHVDLKNGSISDKKTIDDEHQMLTHFTQVHGGGLLAVSTLGARPTKAEHHGNIYAGSMQQPLLRRVDLPPEWEDKCQGEMLSAAASQNGKTALVTNPDGKVLLRVNPHTGKVVAAMNLEAKAVSYDDLQHQFVISSEGGMFDFAETSLGKQTPRRLNSSQFTGAHSLIIAG